MPDASSVRTGVGIFSNPSPSDSSSVHESFCSYVFNAIGMLCLCCYVHCMLAQCMNRLCRLAASSGMRLLGHCDSNINMGFYSYITNYTFRTTIEYNVCSYQRGEIQVCLKFKVVV